MPRSDGGESWELSTLRKPERSRRAANTVTYEVKESQIAIPPKHPDACGKAKPSLDRVVYKVTPEGRGMMWSSALSPSIPLSLLPETG